LSDYDCHRLPWGRQSAPLVNGARNLVARRKKYTSDSAQYCQFCNDEAAAGYWSAFKDRAGRTLNGARHDYQPTFPGNNIPQSQALLVGHRLHPEHHRAEPQPGQQVPRSTTAGGGACHGRTATTVVCQAPVT